MRVMVREREWDKRKRESAGDSVMRIALLIYSNVRTEGNDMNTGVSAQIFIPFRGQTSSLSDPEACVAGS